MNIQGRPLIAGEAEGRLLKLTAPVCFWGGLDPATGKLSDPRHPEFGTTLAKRVVAIPAIVGSSASSQFLLEAMRLGQAPRAILLGEEEVIIATAVLVGREMGYTDFPIVLCDLAELEDGTLIRITPTGEVHARE